jgi:hypothetical protein
MTSVSPQGLVCIRRWPGSIANDDALGQVHHRLVVTESLVDLQHGEFWVVT